MIRPHRQPIYRFIFFLMFVAIGSLLLLAPAAAVAAISESARAHMTRVWQEEFAAPLLFGAAPQDRGRLPDLSSVGETFGADVAYPPGAHLRSDRPHPAVARIVVPETCGTSYGSGTLVDVRDRFGLVITNWHVVRDAQGLVEVHFPDGFQSKARALKVDADWDLAALVVWRPPIEPVPLSTAAPQPGDQLTICGYGQGRYRSATGRCTQYYAPRSDFPQHMVELDVEARQGDSGGPIFNRRGELAGVLFGAGQGTTLGSFGGRVDSFLATLAPDIGNATDDALVSRHSNESDKQKPRVVCRNGICYPADSVPPETEEPVADNENGGWKAPPPQLAGMWATAGDAEPSRRHATLQESPSHQQLDTKGNAEARALPGNRGLEQMKTALAAVGLITVCMFLLKAVC